MKKLVMLLLAAATFSTVFAQSGYNRNEARNEMLGHATYNRRSNDRDGVSRRERDARLQNINRTYDARIYEVRTNRWLRAGERRKEIRLLEAQRAADIRRVNEMYARGNRYDDRYANRNYRRY